MCTALIGELVSWGHSKSCPLFLLPLLKHRRRERVCEAIYWPSTVVEKTLRALPRYVFVFIIKKGDFQLTVKIKLNLRRGRGGGAAEVPHSFPKLQCWAQAISGPLSCGLLFSLHAYVPLMALGFGNPLLYANQAQCGKQTVLLRLKLACLLCTQCLCKGSITLGVRTECCL